MLGPLPPRAAVALELMRALGALALLPLRVLDFSVCRTQLQSELERDLARPVPPVSAPALGPLPDRPLRVFVSCAEASGELHAESFVNALRAELGAAGAPAPEIFGLGGERLAAAGLRQVGDPVQRAAMGFSGMAGALPYYLRLLSRTAAELRAARPDVCCLVDSPALHVPLGRIARRYALPVVHFVTPQYWGWAPWRARAYKGAVDRALTILPFEPAWFARRGIPAVHVGHPLLDRLQGVERGRPADDGGARVLALLPGSRAGVIELNLPWMLRAAGRLRAAHPEAEIVVAQADPAMAELCERLVGEHSAEAGPVNVARDLHGTLAHARAALSVSGTVLIDVLHQRLPAVVIYRLSGRRAAWMKAHLLTAPYFASINLLAARAVVPEFCFAGDGPRAEIEGALLALWSDAEARRACRAGLALAAQRLGPPGASARAAAHALALATRATPP
jgi:lipid-A-disaccharide synthase